MGPLGCGKTAVFRVLTGLWPLKEGKLQRPRANRIAFAFYRPYFPEGTLRDQIIYPETPAEMKQSGKHDQELQKILEELGLHYLVDRVGGFEAFEDWNEALDSLYIFTNLKTVFSFSGAEKQALQIARVIYHAPLFVVMDECVHFNEAVIFRTLENHGITALTITHKASLSKYHGYLLRFDGEVLFF